ncbi:hypothetical protein AX769_11375 [Frondihabitans sp. PAMC 28766]|uniref:hypothetical protein n=1 Tax=Frondihabitans sp. PAMC 28766 TaxID=1795630 RepID=UPI00078E3401|nr:hypothetical protein [Frondihabitans sp. PAMC 28766]AMM20632.1 hypothetical protein AX769_11375 [Frondihabitans sp. PAMC 28766]
MLVNSIGDAVSCLCSIGALGAAIWAGTVAKRCYDLETCRDRERRAEEARSQAVGISAWIGLANGLWQRPGVVIRNGSREPIYAVTAMVSGFEGKTEIDAQVFIPPGQFFIEWKPDPKEKGDEKKTFVWDFAKPVSDVEGGVRAAAQAKRWTLGSIQFRDCRGAYWRRDASGLLMKADKREQGIAARSRETSPVR